MPDETKPNDQSASEPQKPTADSPAIPETAAKPATPEAPKAAAPAAPAAAAPPKPAAPAAAAPPKPAVPPKPPAPTVQPWNTPLTERLKAKYGTGIREAVSYVGQPYLVIDRSVVYEILEILRDEDKFDYLVDVTAVHYPKKEEQFEVIYILYSFPKNVRIRVKTTLRENTEIRSVVPLWPTADWLEREVFDMFGIRFTGHPQLKRILLPDEWKGHPLRKDYGIIQQDKEWVQINLGIESGQ
jgi:NADH-quinone oxidoreductase subunit C